MKCKIGGGLKDTAAILGILILILIAFVFGGFAVGFILGNVFGIWIEVAASFPFEYYINSGLTVVFSALLIIMGIFLVTRFMYLAIFKPRVILNFFVECE